MTELFDWYYLFNLAEFISTGLISREVTLNFPSLGLQTVLITSGELCSITFNNVILSVGLNNKNPFEFDGYAVFYDKDQGVWLGIASGD